MLFPHLGSASVYTRAAMDQLVVGQSLVLGRRQGSADAGAGDAGQEIVRQCPFSPARSRG